MRAIGENEVYEMEIGRRESCQLYTIHGHADGRRAVGWRRVRWCCVNTLFVVGWTPSGCQSQFDTVVNSTIPRTTTRKFKVGESQADEDGEKERDQMYIRPAAERHYSLGCAARVVRLRIEKRGYPCVPFWRLQRDDHSVSPG